MSFIDTNLDAVIERTRRLPERIQGAMHRASLPLRWQDEAREAAEKMLLALASPVDAPHVPLFVRTVVASALPGGNAGFVLSMRNPTPRVNDLLNNVSRMLSGDNPLRDLQVGANRAMLQELILDWVREAKDKDQRDAGKSDEEIAGLISYIMFSPRLEERGMEAREALTPHIVDFLREKLIDLRVAPETVDEWLRAVLAAWKQWAGPRWLEVVREELKK